MNAKTDRVTNALRSGRLLLAAALLTCLISGSAAVAAEDAAPAALTLTPAQAALLALQNSLALQRDAQSVEQAQGRLRQAQALGKLLAQASASAIWMGPVKNSNAFNESLGVSASKPLYTGHRLETQTDLATRGIEAAQALAPVTASATALAAQTVAYNILRLDLLASVASRRATAVAEHLRITRAMEAAGAVPTFEVVQAETELAKAKGEIIAAQTAAQQARAALSQILAVPQTTAISIEEGVPAQAPEGALPELIVTGYAQRPEMTLAERQLRVAEAALQVVKQSLNPRVDAIAEVGQQTVNAVTPPLQWTIGISVTKPLADGGLRRGQEQEQAAKIADAKLAIDTLKQQIALEVSQQSLALREAHEQLVVAEAGEVNARERLRMAELRFSAGLSIGIEVLDAQTALAAAQAATVNARYDIQTSVVRLRRAVGELDDVVVKETAPPAQ